MSDSRKSSLWHQFQTRVFLGKEAAQVVSAETIVSAEEAWQLIQSGALPLDCRSPKECAQHGVLPESLNIPHTEVGDRLEELVPYREVGIVAYCAVGGRSALAKQFLLEQGFVKVVNGGGYQELVAFAQTNGFFDLP